MKNKQVSSFAELLCFKNKVYFRKRFIQKIGYSKGEWFLTDIYGTHIKTSPAIKTYFGETFKNIITCRNPKDIPVQVIHFAYEKTEAQRDSFYYLIYQINMP